MAQFVPFAPSVEVLGQAILAVVNSIEFGRETRLSILKKHGIEDLFPDRWYSQKNYLNAYKEIAEITGNNSLFSIGKASSENALLPSKVKTLELALNAIDVVYHINHQGGDIGYYKLIRFDSHRREAIMECKTPYPSEFDRGIIAAILLRYKPNDSIGWEVVLDRTKDTRLQGGNSCTYFIAW